MRCRWVREGGTRYFVPQCWGGMMGEMAGCYCVKSSRRTLEERIEALEADVKKLKQPAERAQENAG
jgi:hypothetical protein